MNSLPIAKVKVFGSVTILTPYRVNTDLDNQDIVKLDLDEYVYGKTWVFGGDQSFEESDIAVELSANGLAIKNSFAGYEALPEFLAYIQNWAKLFNLDFEEV